MLRTLSPALLLALVAAACGGTDAGPKAPDIVGTRIECTLDACLTIPSDWTAETGEEFISVSHPLDPAVVLGTLGRVDMAGLVEAAGGRYPAPTADVVQQFFDLLDETQDAGIDELVTLRDGSARADGTLEDSIFWYRLIPLEGTIGIGIEVRAPNRSWAAHADVILDGVTLGAP